MTSRVRDKLYLPIVGTQLLGMLSLSLCYAPNAWLANNVVLDLVPFYPKALWHNASAPLHGLISLRSWWAATSGDPYFAQLTHEPWFEVFLYVEGLVQLPLTAYLVWKLASLKPTTGPTELAGLAYGCVTAMGALACCFDIWHMGPDRLAEKHRTQLFWGTYLPFFVIRKSRLPLMDGC